MVRFHRLSILIAVGQPGWLLCLIVNYIAKALINNDFASSNYQQRDEQHNTFWSYGAKYKINKDNYTISYHYIAFSASDSSSSSPHRNMSFSKVGKRYLHEQRKRSIRNAWDDIITSVDSINTLGVGCCYSLWSEVMSSIRVKLASFPGSPPEWQWVKHM